MSEPISYLIQITGKDDLALWSATRADHLAHLKPYIDDGTILFAGPTFAKPFDDPKDMRVNGAVLLFKAESAEEVRSIIKANPMTTAGVWDADNALITPYRCAVRAPAAQ